jgi:hypothetical protein
MEGPYREKSVPVDFPHLHDAGKERLYGRKRTVVDVRGRSDIEARVFKERQFHEIFDLNFFFHQSTAPKKPHKKL